MILARDVIATLDAHQNPSKAKTLSKYFKTGVDEYGHGDIFLGITVPEQRRIARAHTDISLSELSKLLKSDIHEHRFTALEILVMQFEKATQTMKKEILDFYLSHTKWINNWDLVDTSAPYIVGAYLLYEHDRGILETLAKSKSLWERRIAIVSTYTFIRNNHYAETLYLAELLLKDTHDLLHKAVGWMLREVGKRDKHVLEKFLQTHHQQMPRTMLRYAIEKFEKEERRKWMGKIKILNQRPNEVRVQHGRRAK